MKLADRQNVFAANVATLIIFIQSRGYRVSLGEAYRTPEQAALNAKNGKGIKNSLHIKRLAIDLNLFLPDGTYVTGTEGHDLFGSFWEKLHPDNRWGGKFPKPDGNHYEMKDSNCSQRYLLITLRTPYGLRSFYERPTMAKKKFYSDKYEYANLPQEVMHSKYSEASMGLPEDYDDGISGIDKQLANDRKQLMKTFNPKKV